MTLIVRDIGLGARMKTSPDSSANHTGFRVVKIFLRNF